MVGYVPSKPSSALHFQEVTYFVIIHSFILVNMPIVVGSVINFQHKRTTSTWNKKRTQLEKNENEKKEEIVIYYVSVGTYRLYPVVSGNGINES